MALYWIIEREIYPSPSAAEGNKDAAHRTTCTDYEHDTRRRQDIADTYQRGNDPSGCKAYGTQ